VVETLQREKQHAELEKAYSMPSFQAKAAPVSSGISLEADTPTLKDLFVTTTPVVERKVLESPLFATNFNNPLRSETYGGRLAIRSVSRAIVGVAFWVMGRAYAAEQMEGYTGENPKNLLQFVAKGFDATLGEGIKGAVRLFGGSPKQAEDAVMFRGTRDFGYKYADGSKKMGRGYGHDIVAVTFDFAAMSFGDWMARYLISLSDPEVKTAWVKDGHLDIPGGIKELFDQMGKGLLWAAGEDWFVAPVYSYFMKAQRNAINHFSPGFAHDSDNVMFGGSLKVDNAGKVKGDFLMEGMADVVGRFTTYNVGTRYYRELYVNTEKKFNEWKKNGFKIEFPELKPDLTVGDVVKGSIEKVKNSVEYLLVTAFKTVFYMIPSAFVFSALIAPTLKGRGMQINQETGAISENPLVKANMANAWSKEIYGGNPAPWYNNIANVIGTVSFHYGNIAGKVGELLGMNPDYAKQFGEVFGRGSLAYGTYLALKSDIGAAYLDTNRSNLVISRALHAVVDLPIALFSFKGEKIKAAWQELGKAYQENVLGMWKQPLLEPVREIEAEVQMKKDWRLTNAAYQGVYDDTKSTTVPSTLTQEAGVNTAINIKPFNRLVNKPAESKVAQVTASLASDAGKGFTDTIPSGNNFPIAPTSLLERATQFGNKEFAKV